MKKIAIIVAGGKGKRMGADMPKQFLLLENKPILCYSIDAFIKADKDTQIIVVLPEEQISFWKDLCKKHNFTSKHTTIAGGSERFHSVKNGLQLATNDSIIAIHDGVRPLISIELINNAYSLATQHKGVIPVVDSIDSLRILEHESSSIIDRNIIKRVQTPQVFIGKDLKAAYDCVFNNQFTDDASVFEHNGQKVHCCKGDEKNIKITTQVDLQYAKLLLQA